ncbi:SusD/RagB family nutrient-binding outer membrane lipoprotein [Myroides odoratimimus]|uniref:SusD/RagB family nutrient-binding outer membrane lipoprotein n=1 Tax=Myroides odoratimimus TaxID=76832 RepID=UPI00091244FE|nr:SusD/RagB family nutrient-binding outer membrane lipoprotein [Myroides odoratimimus]SHM66046.1 Starch-binding associating with outer membrane [Myroides odoratimimus subsp. xuanwuensis]
MKKYIYKMSLLACFMAFVSCDKDLEDINVNPNKPLEVPTGGLFNKSNKDLMTNTRGGFPSGRMALPWVQYSAQRNYTDEDLYLFRTDVNNSLYSNIFLAAKGYKEIIDIVTDQTNQVKVLTYGHPGNMLSAARIMMVYSQLQALEIYGDIPYYSYGSDDPDFEGMTVGTANPISTPKFAPQDKIYKDMMKELKEAAESITLDSDIFRKGDFIFGDATKMKKFANSLRLKIANRVKNVIPEAKDHITDAIKSGVMTSNDDSVGLKFQNDKVNPAPFYRAAFIDNRNDFAPTNTFVELLKGEEKMVGKKNPFKGIVDPRLYKMVAPTTNITKDKDNKDVETRVSFRASNVVGSIEEGNYVDRTADFYVGMPIGILGAFTGSQTGSVSQFGAAIYKADKVEVLMEYAEVEFILSEVNGWDNTNYKKGIRASMESWGISGGNIDSYMQLVPAANEENVMTQKYIALYMQPYEAWAEYRRTKFPKTFLLPGETRDLVAPGPKGETQYTFVPKVDLKDLPERITFPSDMNLVNKANKDAAAARMGGDKMDTKLIWAKK